MQRARLPKLPLADVLPNQHCALAFSGFAQPSADLCATVGHPCLSVLVQLQVYDVEVDCKQMPSREQLRDELVSTLHAVVCKPAGAKSVFCLACGATARFLRYICSTHGELCAGFDSTRTTSTDAWHRWARA